ncbi:MAG: alpha/beta hydrolase [Myxococcales bacterium]
MKRAAIVALAAIAALYLAVVAFFAAAQRSFVFPAPRGGRVPRGNLVAGPGFRALWIAPQPGAPVVAHFNGNGEDLADAGPVIDLLRSIGAGVLAVEYPGYGLSRADGPPSEEACYRAAAAALVHLRATLHRGPLILEGQSLGTGVAVEMASRGFGDRLILISPFTSMADVAAVHFPWLPARLLVRDRFDSAAKAPRIGMPVLLVHGDADEIVPASMSEELVHRFPQATLRIVADAGHNDLLAEHAEEVRAAIAQFVAANR